MHLLSYLSFLIFASSATVFATPTAVTCAACIHQYEVLQLYGQCYRADAEGPTGKPETVCAYEERAGLPTGYECTYDEMGKLVRRDSLGECVESVPVNSHDCPPCYM